MKRLRYILLILFITVSSFLHSNIVDPISPPRMVNDFVGIFQGEYLDNLEKVLCNYNDTTSTQIYVVVVDDLNGYPIADYAIELGNKWGVGQKGKDNGAVILIKPKIGNSKGEVFIAVGYGLEEKLTDARIGHIIDERMIPYLKKNDYYGATNGAIIAIIESLSGQFDSIQLPFWKSAWFIFLAVFVGIPSLIVSFIYLLSAYLNRKLRKRRNKKTKKGTHSVLSKRSSNLSHNSKSSESYIFTPNTNKPKGKNTSKPSSANSNHSSRSNSSRKGGGGRFGGGGAGRSW